MIFHVGWDHSHGEPGCVVTAGVPLGAEHQGPSRAFRNPLFITCNTPHSPCQGHFLRCSSTAG